MNLRVIRNGGLNVQDIYRIGIVSNLLKVMLIWCDGQKVKMKYERSFRRASVSKSEERILNEVW